MNNQRTQNRFQNLQSIAVLLLLLFTTQTVISQDVSATERQALIDLYNATDGSNWTNNTNWNTSALVTDWFGVTVVDQKVTELKLDQNLLKGSISTSLDNLIYLESLNLYNNQLTGLIPASLGNLISLQRFTLSANQLSGTIPSSLGNLVNLQVFSFSINQLTGSIPVELGNLANLTELRIARNNLDGSIPVGIASLTNLQYIELSDNQLSGNVPDFTNLPLSLLWFDKNNFHFENFESEHNSYTTSFGNYRYSPQAKVDLTESLSVAEGASITLTSTALLSPNNTYQWYKDGVAIAGATSKDYIIANALPADAGIYHFLANNTIVTGLELERNPITLTIDASACGVSAIEKQALLDLYNATNGDNWTNTLANNQPWDTNIPVCDWYNVTVVDGKVVSLFIVNNNHSGNLPASLGNLENLTELRISDNQLTGSIPSELGNLTNLTRLDVNNNNQLAGIIPPELGNLINLNQLAIVQNNNITGSIPSELGNLTILERLLITGNPLLSGSIPQELGGLVNAREFYLYNNNLTGNIPSSLGNLSSTQLLLLYNNQLTGNIPSELGNLANVVAIRLENNQLSGVIPSSITGLSGLVNFRFDSNQFIFSNFETEHPIYEANIGSYTYAPQAKVDLTESLSVAEGGSITLTSTTLTSPNNTYQWYKDGTAIAGATGKDYVIANALPTDAGIYHFLANNTIVTGLELERNPITLTIGSGDTCGVSEIEKQALLDLYNATNGDNWINTLANDQPWDTNIPVCDWFGVTVVDGKVTRLKLDNNNLVGNIPTTLNQLSSLEQLLLNSNVLSGTIPVELGELSNLNNLNLTSNQLTGSIPTEFGQLSNLRVISIQANQLTGSIPTELGLLTNLEYLWLNTNQLSGTIPIELGQLSNLRFLYLLGNNLTGTIPIELGQLSNLEFLYLQNNQLSGGIPSELGLLSNLKALNLGANLLSGSIPTELGQLTNLESLYLYTNQFSGNIPLQLGQLNNLVRLYLYENQFSGAIPSSISNLLNLTILAFENNKYVFSNFESEHITYQTNLTTYTYSPQAKVDLTESLSVAEGGSITLTSTALTSTNNTYQWYKDGTAIAGATSKDYVIANALPVDAGVYHILANNTIVTGLELERNPITLTIDASECVVPQIERDALIALYNTVGGANWNNNTNWNTNIPVCDWFGITVVNGNVTEISLLNNNLVGILPSELENLVNLTSLNLRTNQLTGAIPPELGNLSNLTLLYLWGNQLTGSIPIELGNMANLKFLHLSFNQLTGSIPSELGNLSNLLTLSINNNLLVGNIPPQLGNLTNLTSLDSGTNQLTGEIPLEFTNLSKLTILRLENNQLTGNLTSLPANMIIINISNNNFIFSGVENEFVNYQNNANTFIYSPQAKVDLIESLSVAEGGSITLTSIALTSTNNTYQWYKDGTIIAGATGKDFVITNALPADAGVYHFLANNTIVTGLELERNPITLTIEPGDTCGVSAIEKQALLDLYNATNGDNWINTLANNQPWDANIPVCDWFGVTVVDGKVTQLLLVDNNLVGIIPSEIGNLTNVLVLGLLSNLQLTGSIPLEIGNLQNLTALSFSSNGLSGAIPVQLGNLLNLTRLDLFSNQFTGAIPSELGNLTLLVTLDLNNNLFEGLVPIELENLTNLQTLVLNDNQLSGILPTFSNLQTALDISDNYYYFSGFETNFNDYSNNIIFFTYSPQAKVDLTESLSVAEGGSITLTSNVLTSSNNTYQWYKDDVAIVGATNKDYIISNALPADAGVYHFLANNTIVTGLELERNPITLTIGPGDTCGVSEIEKQTLLDLYNATNGDNWINTLANNQPWDTNTSVCDWFGVTVANDNVIRVVLASNNLVGTISITLENLLNLRTLRLSDNQLSGSIPPSMGNLPQLQNLLLNGNNLSGTIPVELANISSLLDLVLYENNLTGFIPSELSTLPNLRDLNLLRNNLTGTIPAEFGDFSNNLFRINIGDNQLEGRIPASLASLSGLTIFRFYINKFIFSDFEPEFGQYQTNLTGAFAYNPQAKVDLTETILVPEGDGVTLTSNVLTSPNNTYQWYKDGVVIAGATNKDYVIANVLPADAGVYHFLANNTIVTGLELERNPITLNIEPPNVDCIDSLSGLVDGSFEAAVNVVINGRNGTLGNTGWLSGSDGTPDTFLPPLTNNNDPYLLYNFNSSPNGGVCAGSLRVGSTFESFYTDVVGLIPGQTYVVEFYQANATNLLLPQLFEEAYGSWAVYFGSEEISERMPPVSTTPLWERASVEFTVSNTTQRIQFTATSSATDVFNSYPVYMLIDGIRIYKKQKMSAISGCYDIDTQFFCSSDDIEPTIADLTSPLSGTTVWYSESIGGVRYYDSDELADLVSYFIWADNGSGNPRVPVEIVFDLGAPEGNEYQSFEILQNPTIADLQATGTNITWYNSQISTTPLATTTALVSGEVYYAAQNSNPCRLGVEVFVGVLPPTGNGFQEFCSSDNPTIADLVMEVTNASYSLLWFDAETGGTAYSDTDLLVDGTTYYVAQTDGTNTTEERFPVTVSIIDVDAQVIIYERDIAVEQGETIATLTSFFQLDSAILWYDIANGGTAYRDTDELIEGETYYAQIGEGLCSALEVLAVTVYIEEVIAPELITCIKFVPQPGDRYVISGWVREDALIAESSEIRNFSEVSDIFIDLLEYLKEKVLAQESIPDVYVLKLDPNAPNIDALLPYIKNATSKNVTVYNFENVKENTDGINRTVGFSFSLDPDNTYKFTYMTPKVRWTIPLFPVIVKDYHYPMLNNPTIEITFKDVSVCGTNFCINSDFSITGDNPYLSISLIDEQSEGSTVSGIESSVEFFTYRDDPDYQVMEYLNTSIELTYKDIDGIVMPQDSNDVIFRPKGAVIDGWQRISTDFTIPVDAANITITLKNIGEGLNAYFDDVRMHPFNSNMKSFVYDPITQRLQAELDENNYATFYEYDSEGGLVRVKKETERGVYTIQETRSGNSKLNN